MNQINNKEEVVSNTELEKTLAGFYAQFIRFQNLKDIQGIRACLHKESLLAGAMIQNFEGLFDHFTLDITVQMEKYISADDDYIYCRFKQKIEKISGPEFNDMRADNLVLFKRDEDEWKIWNCFPLVMEAL